MKKLFKVALVAVSMLFVGTLANAQTKIGYINMNDLIGAMPQVKTVQTQMQTYQKQFVDNITSQNATFQKEVSDYNAKKASMTDAARIAKEAELGDMQKRIQDYQTTAQQQVEAKSAEYMKPLYDQANTAISAVAKEKGYTYVLDSSTTNLVVKPDADDLIAAVKAKMGLK
ncbi:MAG: OmpH family outer membrane protein [Mucilaginibacter sp.]